MKETTKLGFFFMAIVWFAKFFSKKRRHNNISG